MVAAGAGGLGRVVGCSQFYSYEYEYNGPIKGVRRNLGDGRTANLNDMGPPALKITSTGTTSTEAHMAVGSRYLLVHT